MINVSDEFKRLMQERTDFYEEAEVTLIDGTFLSFGADDFTCSNNSVSDGAGESTLPLGCAIGRTMQMEIVNDDDRLSQYDFFGAKIKLTLKFRLSKTVESIDVGTFTVLQPETLGETVIITAVDDMYKTDKPYDTGLAFPASAGTVFRDACTNCGIAYETAAFLNDDFAIEKRPDGNDLTYRQVIGYVAMLAAGNARINRSGKAEIVTYNLANLNAEVNERRHELTDWIGSPKIDASDITITGVKTTKTVELEDGGREEQDVLAGEEGYVLAIDNPLITGKEQMAVDMIADVLVGVSFRKFSGDYVAYPLAEFMDPVKIADRRGHVYFSVLTDIDFVFFGRTTFSNSAAAPARNSRKYQTPENKAVIKARQLVEQERTSRENAIAALSQKIANNNGLFITKEEQEDGSFIYYLHDKPTVAESTNVVKVTAEAFGFSTDGGETYPFGFEITGDMITKILSAEGINADWIKVGTVPLDNIPAEELKKSFDVHYTSPYYVDGKLREYSSYANSYTDSKLAEAQRTFNEQYLLKDNAQSQFENCLIQLSQQIIENPESVTQYFSFYETLYDGIREVSNAFNEYKRGTEGYIRSGIVDYDDEGLPIYGVAIGQNLNVSTNENGEDVISKMNFRAIHTAKKLSFWQDLEEVAYVSNNRLYITNITVMDNITAGSWIISSGGGGLKFQWNGG